MERRRIEKIRMQERRIGAKLKKRRRLDIYSTKYKQYIQMEHNLNNKQEPRKFN